MIDRNNIGTCKKCGEVRDFGALLVKGRKKLPPYRAVDLKKEC